MEFHQRVGKELSQTDVTSKFVVKEEWLGTLLPGNLEPGSKTNILVVDDWEKEFTFILKVRKILDIDLNREPGPYYYKPEFMSEGWKYFVAQKGLVAGQTIWFWRLDAGRIRVHID